MRHNLNNLDLLNGTALAAALASIPEGITELNLSSNRLGFASNADLCAALAAIPASITSLDLSNNDLSKKTTAELAVIFAAIPKNVIDLKLRCNLLGWDTLNEKPSTEKISAIFYSIPANIIYLDMSANALTNTPASAFANIPKNVKELTLFRDEIGNRPKAELIKLGNSLPHLLKVHAGGEVDDIPAFKMLNDHIGSWYLGAYQQLAGMNKSNTNELKLPNDIAIEVMSFLAPPDPEFQKGIKKQHGLQQEQKGRFFFKRFYKSFNRDKGFNKCYCQAFYGLNGYLKNPVGPRPNYNQSRLTP